MAGKKREQIVINYENSEACIKANIIVGFIKAYSRRSISTDVVRSIVVFRFNPKEKYDFMMTDKYRNMIIDLVDAINYNVEEGFRFSQCGFTTAFDINANKTSEGGIEIVATTSGNAIMEYEDVNYFDLLMDSLFNKLDNLEAPPKDSIYKLTRSVDKIASLFSWLFVNNGVEIDVHRMSYNSSISNPKLLATLNKHNKIDKSFIRKSLSFETYMNRNTRDNSLKK